MVQKGKKKHYAVQVCNRVYLLVFSICTHRKQVCTSNTRGLRNIEIVCTKLFVLVFLYYIHFTEKKICTFNNHYIAQICNQVFCIGVFCILLHRKIGLHIYYTWTYEYRDCRVCTQFVLVFLYLLHRKRSYICYIICTYNQESITQF